MKQILIVDDDIHIGNMLQEVLTKEGYGVSRAYSGTEAVLFLSRNRPNLILLDLMLPGLSGEDVLAHTSGIPVIVVSAKAEIQDKVSLLLDGAVDYVTKPFHVQELLARIHDAFESLKPEMVQNKLNGIYKLYGDKFSGQQMIFIYSGKAVKVSWKDVKAGKVTKLLKELQE